MLRLLTDPRVTLDPTRVGRLSACMVWTLHDVLQVRDHAEYLGLPERRQ